MDVRVQLVDGMFLTFTVSKTLERSASVHLLFAFEYIIQASVLASTAIKYGLSLIDNHFEGRWENKVSMPDEFCSYANACANLNNSVITCFVCIMQGVYVFYLQLLTDMLHLFVYVVFFVIVFTNYGLPLHLVCLELIAVLAMHLLSGI